MEYAQRREGYYEEEAEEMIGEIGKHPFSPSSSSSSPSYYHNKGIIPQQKEPYDPDVFKFHGQDSGETSHRCAQKEHMFDKVVTPSDVGKLNRLVIPKQHAEKYFPLDSSGNEKGLLLNFEDRSGKPWRFRYSYWSSSQSYVMTKGWSRFVKEKKLDAGDIVSFERGIGELEKDHLYIDWRRKPNAPDPRTTMLPSLSLLPRPLPWGRFFVPQSHGNYGYNVVNPCSGSIFCLSSITAPQQVGGDVPMVFNSVPVVHAKAATRKRVRLFGVNLDCPIQEDTECDILSSTTISHSGSSLPPLQLRPFNGSPLPTEFPKKGKPSIPFKFDM